MWPSGKCIRGLIEIMDAATGTLCTFFYTGYTIDGRVAYLADGMILSTPAETHQSVFEDELDRNDVATLREFTRGLGRPKALKAFLEKAYRRGVSKFVGRVAKAVYAWRANLEDDFMRPLLQLGKENDDLRREQAETMRHAKRMRRDAKDGELKELGRDLIEAGKSSHKRDRFDTLKVQRVYACLFTPGGRRSALFAEENLNLMRQRIHEAAPLTKSSKKEYTLSTRAIAAGYTYKVYGPNTDPAKVARFAWWLYTVMRTVDDEEHMVVAIHRVCSSQRALWLPPFGDRLWKIFFAAMMSMAIEGTPPFQQPDRCAPDPLCFYDEY